MSTLPTFTLSPASHHCIQVMVGLPHYDNFMLLNTCSKSSAVHSPRIFFDYALQVAAAAVEKAAKGKMWVLDYGNRWTDLGVPSHSEPDVSQPELLAHLPSDGYLVRIPAPLVQAYMPLEPDLVAINALRWFIPTASVILRQRVTFGEVSRIPGHFSR